MNSWTSIMNNAIPRQRGIAPHQRRTHHHRLQSVHQKCDHGVNPQRILPGEIEEIQYHCPFACRHTLDSKGRARQNLTIIENTRLSKLMNGWLNMGHQKGHIHEQGQRVLEVYWPQKQILRATRYRVIKQVDHVQGLDEIAVVAGLQRPRATPTMYGRQR